MEVPATGERNEESGTSRRDTADPGSPVTGAITRHVPPLDTTMNQSTASTPLCTPQVAAFRGPPRHVTSRHVTRTGACRDTAQATTASAGRTSCRVGSRELGNAAVSSITVQEFPQLLRDCDR
jgi:hypothetical protein